MRVHIKSITQQIIAKCTFERAEWSRVRKNQRTEEILLEKTPGSGDAEGQINIELWK
jgi:hypothetical protein